MLPDYRIRQRDYLIQITQALTQELDLDSVLERILRFSIELLAGQAGLIVLRGESGGWDIRVSQGISPNYLKQLNPLLNAIPDNEDPQQFEIPEINRILSDLALAARLQLLSGVGLPLIIQKKVLGVIFIFRGYPGIFSNNDRILLSYFATQAAIAVQNAMLYTRVTLSKQHMDAILDSAADGILILNSSQLIERSNSAFSRMIAKPPEKIIGKRHDEVVRLNRLALNTSLENAIAGGWPLTPSAQLYVEGDLDRDNHAPLPVGITYAPLLSESGKLRNIIATFRDISRFRKAEELQNAFISEISHELKTPVALIKGYVSTLRREDVHWDKKVIAESLQVIEEEADRLNIMIENLLDATRLQIGGMTLKKTELSIPLMAKRLATRFQAQTTRHTINSQFPDDFPTILGDETRIEQVLSNLIGNAIKYSDSGEILISGQVRTDMVIICVKDEGPGIAPQDMPYIFDRFYRSPEVAREKKGAGLGLYLARSIVEAHNGKIWVDNNQKEGTRICFSLPR